MQKPLPQDWLEGVNLTWFEAWLRVDGGHAIVPPAELSELGFNDAVVAQVTRTHVSDTSSVKGCIFGADGRLLKSLRGVYVLEFVRKLCDALGLPSTSTFFGRGGQYRELSERILEVVRRRLAESATGPQGLNSSASNL